MNRSGIGVVGDDLALPGQLVTAGVDRDTVPAGMGNFSRMIWMRKTHP
ncbi:hypothetical protein HCA61_22850 [Rhodococcus sp. HNM0563]|nr:hypothetical protein [Rhodococcus sp. HNM0563]NLU65078.1 hypothetical protein [Rhodococcus sp. HNM0563]